MKKGRRTKATSDNFPLSEVSPDCAVSCNEVHISPIAQKKCSDAVRRFIEFSLAVNTQKAYRSDIAHFKCWGGSFPANPRVVAQYLAEHADTHAVSTLQRRLIALRIVHRSLDMKDPVGSALVRSTLRGIRRVKGKPQRRAQALLRVDIEQALGVAGKTLWDVRNRALLLIGFSGALRRSELISIDVEHLELRDDGVSINIPVSKTDPYRAGRSVFIQRKTACVCPIEALQFWLEKATIRSGAVFRSVKSHNRLGSRLSGEAVSIIVKAAAVALGRSKDDYSGHSLRAGYITDNAIRGDQLWTIQRQTGHASLEMLSRYIRASQLVAVNSRTQCK